LTPEQTKNKKRKAMLSLATSFGLSDKALKEFMDNPDAFMGSNMKRLFQTDTDDKT